MPKAETEVIKIHQREVQTGELAIILSKSKQWIATLTRDGILKQSGRGKYILSEAIQAYIEHIAGGKEEDGKLRLIDHKTELTRINAEKANIQLSHMRADSHTSEDVETVMNHINAAFRKRILAIPDMLAQQLAGVDDVNVVKSRITKALHEALTELSEYNPEHIQEDTTESE